MVKDYGFVHLSAGDLLRGEQERPGSQYGDLIRHYIKEGLIVPMEITIKVSGTQWSREMRGFGYGQKRACVQVRRVHQVRGRPRVLHVPAWLLAWTRWLPKQQRSDRTQANP